MTFLVPSNADGADTTDDLGVTTNPDPTSNPDPTFSNLGSHGLFEVGGQPITSQASYPQSVTNSQENVQLFENPTQIPDVVLKSPVLAPQVSSVNFQNMDITMGLNSELLLSPTALNMSLSSIATSPNAKEQFVCKSTTETVAEPIISPQFCDNISVNSESMSVPTYIRNKSTGVPVSKRTKVSGTGTKLVRILPKTTVTSWVPPEKQTPVYIGSNVSSVSEPRPHLSQLCYTNLYPTPRIVDSKVIGIQPAAMNSGLITSKGGVVYGSSVYSSVYIVKPKTSSVSMVNTSLTSSMQPKVTSKIQPMRPTCQKDRPEKCVSKESNTVKDNLYSNQQVVSNFSSSQILDSEIQTPVVFTQLKDSTGKTIHTNAPQGNFMGKYTTNLNHGLNFVFRNKQELPTESSTAGEVKDEISENKSRVLPISADKKWTSYILTPKTSQEVLPSSQPMLTTSLQALTMSMLSTSQPVLTTSLQTLTMSTLSTSQPVLTNTLQTLTMSTLSTSQPVLTTSQQTSTMSTLSTSQPVLTTSPQTLTISRLATSQPTGTASLETLTISPLTVPLQTLTTSQLTTSQTVWTTSPKWQKTVQDLSMTTREIPGMLNLPILSSIRESHEWLQTPKYVKTFNDQKIQIKQEISYKENETLKNEKDRDEFVKSEDNFVKSEDDSEMVELFIYESKPLNMGSGDITDGESDHEGMQEVEMDEDKGDDEDGNRGDDDKIGNHGDITEYRLKIEGSTITSKVSRHLTSCFY